MKAPNSQIKPEFVSKESGMDAWTLPDAHDSTKKVLIVRYRSKTAEGEPCTMINCLEQAD